MAEGVPTNNQRGTFIVTFDIVTNKDFEIFLLPEMTEHGIFTLVS